MPPRASPEMFEFLIATPLNSAFNRIVGVRSTPSKVTSRRLTLERSTPARFTPKKVAPERDASFRPITPDISTFVKEVPWRTVAEKSVPVRVTL